MSILPDMLLPWLKHHRQWFTWNILSRLQRPSAYLGDHMLLTRTMTGQYLYLDSRDTSITPALLIWGYSDGDITRAFQRLVKPGMRIVDVGANVGYYTMLAAHLTGPTGKVTAFEPNRRLAKLAEMSRAANGFDNVRIVNAAVADHCGEVSLSVPARCFGGANLHGYTDAGPTLTDEPAETQQVDCTTLDEFFRDDKTPIDLVKIDTEGAEPMVIEGMTELIGRNPRMRLLIEFYPRLIRAGGRDPAALLDRAGALGFEIHLIGRNGELRHVSREALLANDDHVDLVLSR